MIRPLLEQVRQLSVSLTDPARVRTLLDTMAPTAGEAATLAPSEAAPDAALVSGVLAQYRSAFQAADYELAKLPPDLVVKLQTPPVQQAILHLGRVAEQAC